jgi:hypothetical protein
MNSTCSKKNARRTAAKGALAILFGSLAAMSVGAQEIDTDSLLRRLPPLTVAATVPAQSALAATSPAHAKLSDNSVATSSAARTDADAIRAIAFAPSDAARAGQQVQRTNAIGDVLTEADGKLCVRRLPPLADARISPVRRTDRARSAAHISGEPTGSRPADGASQVLAGSFAVAHRAVYLGIPPQPAMDSDLGDLGRSTLRPPGPLPRDVPSPKAISPAH